MDTHTTPRSATGARPFVWTALVTLLSMFVGLAVQAREAAAPSAQDLRWLNRVAWGADAQSIAQLSRLGRRAWLDQQLRPGGDSSLPEALQQALATTPGIARPLGEVLADVQAENQRINQLPNEIDKQAARQARNQAAQQARYEAGRAQLLRAVYSPWQLQERMTWFWLNHFSVHADKGNLRWMMADWQDHALRDHALGKFGDLVWATVTHPAMLEYLDNTQSASGKINENFARELLELHTLGVDAGYSQADVQELARVLTGLGVNLSGKAARLKLELQDAYVLKQGFEFNPARHDSSSKKVLGMHVQPGGLEEVRGVIEGLARHPATARLISRKLATYFVADEPPAALVERMAKRFTQADGDIAAVLRVLFDSREFAASLADGAPVRLKDPIQFVISSLRLAYNTGEGNGAALFNNLRPVQGWLSQLNQPQYGRITPDGYPLATATWANPGQLARRFEIARAIGGSNSGLFNSDDNTVLAPTGFPRPGGQLYYSVWQQLFSPDTRSALEKANSQTEWNLLLLASPEWMSQ